MMTILDGVFYFTICEKTLNNGEEICVPEVSFPSEFFFLHNVIGEKSVT